MTIEELLRVEFYGIDQPAPSPEAVRLLLAQIEKRRVPGPEIVAGVCFALYAAVSVQRHHRMESGGYDLGIFEQIVRAYAHGQAPIVELKGPGFNALGDHFHPILILLAPAYRLFPMPETLLVAQAALVAASIIPIGRAA